MNRSRPRRLAPALLALLVLLLGAQTSVAQDYRPEDPIPPGARGKVLPISGKVTEIRGLARGVAGRAQALDAALKDLGAKVTEQEIKIELSADVLFDFDKADLRSEAGPALDKVAEVLKGYPAATTLIEGHTDSVGGDRYNQRLSERRAAAVKQALAARGVTGAMATRGWGRTRPVVPNTTPEGRDDPEGRQKNRRVEITLKKG